MECRAVVSNQQAWITGVISCPSGGGAAVHFRVVPGSANHKVSGRADGGIQRGHVCTDLSLVGVVPCLSLGLDRGNGVEKEIWRCRCVVRGDGSYGGSGRSLYGQYAVCRGCDGDLGNL